MSRAIRINPNYTLRQLEDRLRALEAQAYVVTELKTDGTETVATVEEANVILDLIVLVLDPKRNEQPLPSQTLVCRGEVFIQGSTQCVAAFRPGS